MRNFDYNYVMTGKHIKKRKPFKISTKKKEWNKSAGREETNFKSTSKCRCNGCRRKLIWGSGTYDFDHKDNNSSNNSQRNCFLVCKVCHGKVTKITKKRVICNITGMLKGHKTYKRKVGYKQSTRRKKIITNKRRKINRSNILKFKMSNYNEFAPKIRL